MDLWDRDGNCWSAATRPRMDVAPCPLGYGDSPPQDTQCHGDDGHVHWHAVYGTAEYLLCYDADGNLLRDDRPWQMTA